MNLNNLTTDDQKFPNNTHDRQPDTEPLELKPLPSIQPYSDKPVKCPICGNEYTGGPGTKCPFCNATLGPQSLIKEPYTTTTETSA